VQLEEEAGVVAVSMEKRGILTFHFDDNPQPWEVRTDVLLLLGDIHVVFWKSKQNRIVYIPSSGIANVLMLWKPFAGACLPCA
jgi:hypothetical protein